jgi:hypothetical protein
VANSRVPQLPFSPKTEGETNIICGENQEKRGMFFEEQKFPLAPLQATHKAFKSSV